MTHELGRLDQTAVDQTDRHSQPSKPSKEQRRSDRNHDRPVALTLVLQGVRAEQAARPAGLNGVRGTGRQNKASLHLPPVPSPLPLLRASML